MTNEPMRRAGRELSLRELSEVHGGDRRQLSEREKQFLRKRWLGAQESRDGGDDGGAGRDRARR